MLNILVQIHTFKSQMKGGGSEKFPNFSKRGGQNFKDGLK